MRVSPSGSPGNQLAYHPRASKETRMENAAKSGDFRPINRYLGNDRIYARSKWKTNRKLYMGYLFATISFQIS